MTLREKLLKLRDELKQLFVERDDIIDGSLVALLSAQHVLLIGPPGTAKSMLADEICRRIDGARYFQWLLTRFTTPEELFGAVSLKALERDDYRRVTTHKLPEAHIGFLDEIFKANSSILNSTLSIINERRFHNGTEIVQVPLQTLFGASNELPEDDELTALYDRFLLRFVVEYISEEFRFLRMLEFQSPESRVRFSLDELQELQRAVQGLAIPDHIYRALGEIRRELGKKEIIASDRRYRQCLGVIRAHAYLSGDDTVSDRSLGFLEHALWKEPGERTEIRSVINEIVLGYEQEVQELLYQAREIEEYMKRQWDSEDQRSQALIEGHTKLRNILAKVDRIVERANESRRSSAHVEEMKDHIQDIQKRMLESL